MTDSGSIEAGAIRSDQEIVKPRHSKADISDPKHIRTETAPKHARAHRSKSKILKTIIAAELISVILACTYLYSIWCHNFEVRVFGQVCTTALANASESLSGQANTTVHDSLKTYKESVTEEVYEYMWTTENVEYRTGADMSYKSAGTLDEDKMIKRTGITRSGWSRIEVDGEEYYIPEGELTDDIPESLPIADGVKGEYQKYALSLLPDFGWDSSELEPLIYLWNRESGWNPGSHNKRSGAHGIPQALPASKMASEGSDYYTNAEPQIRWGLKYIAGRYGSPSAAWAHFQSSGWY